MTSLTEPKCLVYALDPNKPRQLILMHRERGLAAGITLRGDEPNPHTVRLGRTAVVTGRLLDSDGQPLRRIKVASQVRARIGAQFVHYLEARIEVGRADEDGRFRVEGVIPGMQLDVR